MSDRAAGMLARPALEGTRWGLVVMTLEGREIVSLNPDGRFLPASNTKIFTVAAAFHRLGDMARPDPRFATSVRLEPRPDGPPDIALVGGGDAMLLDAEDCQRDCLSTLADIVAANGVTQVRSVIGDDSLYPDERWGPGWSREDLIVRSGAPASALSVNSNEVTLKAAPGAAVLDRVQAEWREGDNYLTLTNAAQTIAGAEDRLRIERKAGSEQVLLYGELGLASPPQTIPLAVEDPARVAALRFRALLEARGVVAGAGVATRHRMLSLADEPRSGSGDPPIPPTPPGAELGRLLPPPLIEDVTFLMKQSQNQHAEMLLRRLGMLEGHGSRADGLAVIEAMLNEAGAPRWAWDFADGSGMSVYNRVTPRTVANFLGWTTRQAWGSAFRETFPVGGVDGTLRRRFAGTSLEGRIYAKTGTLAGTSALSGFMQTRAGRTVIFSAYANDRPSVAESAISALDATLVAISEMN